MTTHNTSPRSSYRASQRCQHTPRDRRRRQSIYLAAPVPAFETARYGEALQYLKGLYPGPRHVVLSSRDLFASTVDWKATYREKLSGVTACYVLLLDGLAGYGCKAEAEYVAGTLGRPVFALAGDRSAVPISGWVPSRSPHPSLAWHVLDARRKRVS